MSQGGEETHPGTHVSKVAPAGTWSPGLLEGSRSGVGHMPLSLPRRGLRDLGSSELQGCLSRDPQAKGCGSWRLGASPQVHGRVRPFGLPLVLGTDFSLLQRPGRASGRAANICKRQPPNPRGSQGRGKGGARASGRCSSTPDPAKYSLFLPPLY